MRTDRERLTDISPTGPHGISLRLRLSNSLPAAFFRVPPHCLRKNGTAVSRQASRITSTRFSCMDRAPGQDSPPTITQSMPVLS